MGLGEHKNLMKPTTIAKICIESEVARRGTPLLRDVAVIRSGSGPALSASCRSIRDIKGESPVEENEGAGVCSAI